MLKWYLDKDRNIVKLKSKFDGFQNMQLKYGGTVTQKLTPAYYLTINKVIHSTLYQLTYE